MKTNYDVIIVGAGPAGNASAKLLAEKGFNIAIIEKEKLPRNKVCSGMISKRCISSLKKLDVDIDEVSLQSYKGFVLRFKDFSVNYHWNKDYIWGVNRKDFDYHLTNKSIDSGAILINEKATGFKEENNIIKVHTKKGVIKARVLLAADGINSTVRNCMEIKYDKRKIGVGVAAEIKTTDKKIQQLDSMITVDFSYLKEGVSYIMPKIKGGTIHISMGTYADSIKNAGISLKELLRKFGTERNIFENLNDIHGAVIPLGGTVDSFGNRNVILLGDAAGLVSCFSGEGIPYALESGIIAADCTVNFFEKKEPLADSYHNSIQHLAKEINDYSLTLQKRLFGSDRHRERVVKTCGKNEDLLNILSDIFTQEITYKEGVKKLSPMRLLPSMIKTILQK